MRIPVTRAKVQTPHTRARRAVSALCIFLLTTMLLIPDIVAGARLSILVVTTERGPAYEEVMAGLRTAVADVLDKKLSVREISTGEFTRAAERTPDKNAPDLIVTVGTGAALAVVQSRPAVPVYCSFLPQSAYAVLADRVRGEPARLSAIYLDQPFARQLRLIRLALPGHARIGVILGPDSRKIERTLRSSAIATGATLRVEQISDEKQLVGAIHRVMDDTEILLAVPDALVFNRSTAQSALLTTYRLGKPVAGYSRAYVTAGALFAVYSTPAQIGRQVGEELLTILDKPGRPLPVPSYPRYFSVEMNERVARSLGFEPGQVGDLTRRLAEQTTEISHE